MLSIIRHLLFLQVIEDCLELCFSFYFLFPRHAEMENFKKVLFSMMAGNFLTVLLFKIYSK